MRRVLVRMRASAGQLTLLSLLTVVAGMLVIGAPRIANGLIDRALRSTIEALPFQVKDLTYRGVNSYRAGDPRPRDIAGQLGAQRKIFYPALQDHIGESWWRVGTQLDSSDVTGTGLPGRARFALSTGNGLLEATRLVEGRWPKTQTIDGDPIEVVLTEQNATLLKQRLGSRFRFGPLPAEIVGIIAPLDEHAAIWDTQPLALRAYVPRDDGETYRAVLFTDVDGLQRLYVRGVGMAFERRYRIDLTRLDLAVLPSLVEASLAARQQGMGGGIETGLDTALSRFADSARAGQAMLAVVQASTLATLIGLVLLSARLAVSRRRAEFALLRARGGALLTIGARGLVETLPVIPLAAVAGWVLGGFAPGRHERTELVLIMFAVIALLAIPVMSMMSVRRQSFGGEREDVSSAKVSAKRRTAELSLLVLAGLGVWLLRRRGLNPTADVDMYLVAVPVLLAAGAAVVTLRAVPAPLGWASRIAARTRGSVGFLGLARAGRAAPAAIGPIAVLVVAVCTTVFSIGVASTVDTGRDRATDHGVVGDAIINGYFFAPDTVQALAALPGVTEVASYAAQPATNLLTDGTTDAKRIGQVYLVVVDGPAFARAARESGRQVDLPGVISAATDPGELPPALVSPAVAAKFGDKTKATADLQGQSYEFRAAGVVEQFPMIPRTATNFVVLPWQALPARSKPVNPTGFVLSGSIDQSAVTSVGNEGQLRWVSAIATPPGGFVPVTTIVTWDDQRQKLERVGANGMLTFAYTVGTVGGIMLALLAVGFTVLAGARTRGRVLSRLRTMGLSRGQGRRLLLVELTPVVSVAVLTGALVGVALPLLLAPALGLAAFTDGFVVGVRIDPLVVTGALALVVAGLATAVLVETLFNRRLRLGQVLRLGSFDAGES